jgi:hypothetical protein
VTLATYTGMSNPSESPLPSRIPTAVERALDRGAYADAVDELAKFFANSTACPADEVRVALETRLAGPEVAGEAIARLRRMLADPACPREAGRLWARLSWRREDFQASTALRTLVRSGPAGEEAAVEWVRLLVDHGRDDELIRLAILTELYLFSSPRAWMAVATGLRERRLYQLGKFWVQHWREVPALDAGQLLVVAELWRGAGWPERGANINRDAVERFPTAAECAAHRGWLAVDAVARDDYNSAAQLLSQTQAAGARIDDRFLATLVTSTIAVRQAEPDRRPQVLTDARQSIDEVVASYPELPREPARLSFYHFVLNRLADQNGFGTRLWAWWQRRG